MLTHILFGVEYIGLGFPLFIVLYCYFLKCVYVCVILVVRKASLYNQETYK